MTIDKNKISIYILTILTIAVFYSNLIAYEFAGGSGTEADPWQIKTAEHLNNVRKYLGEEDKYFVQTADIDLYDATREGGAYWNAGKGWKPIGEWEDNPFQGNYNGSDFQINGLYINCPDEDYQGLFGYVSFHSTVKNVSMQNVNITGRDFVGALIGGSMVSNIINCHSTGTIAGNDYIGGLIGINKLRDNVSYCHSTVIVKGNNYVGGLVGDTDITTIKNCYSTGAVSGNDYVGGISGRSRVTDIDNCYSKGNVKGNMYVGGMIGKLHWHSELRNSYSIGNVSGDKIVGGIVGYFDHIVSIENTYYNYDKVLINQRNVHTAGAIFDEYFSEWLNNDMAIDIDHYLTKDSDNYLISSVEEFKLLPVFSQNGYRFLLTQNLDLNDQTDFYIPYFTGQFNGGGHIINNLNIGLDFVSGVGLFGNTVEAVISNLGVTNIKINGSYNVGALVGHKQASVLNEHHFQTQSDNNNEHKSPGIVNCYSTGEVRGIDSVGGLVGKLNRDTYMMNCYSMVNVYTQITAGGLVGFNWGASIRNCFSTGRVVGDDDIGGLVGAGDTRDGDYSTNYWNTVTSQQSSSEGGEGRTTAQLTYPYNENTYTGWDFEEVWKADVDGKVNDGYPYLRELER